MSEILFVVILVVGMLIAPAIVGFMGGGWYLFGVFGLFFICFGLMEWLAVKKTGKTISQQFWKFAKEHPKAKWVVIGLMIAGWLALMAHFGFHN